MNHLIPIILVAAFVGQGSLAAGAADSSLRRQISLRDGWLVKQLDSDTPDVAALAKTSGSPDKTWFPARMPAQVHEILLDRGLIADPHIGKNAAACAWVSDKNWVYVCRFLTPDKIGGPAFLRFEGLDTLADAYLNGVSIGHFANMFREFSIDVRERLAPAGRENTLLVVFFSPIRFKEQCRRKASSDYGSYLGASPHFAKIGIYRDVVLDVPDRAWLEDISVRTELLRDTRTARIRARVEAAGGPTTIRWVLAGPSGQEVTRGSVERMSGGADLDIPVEDAKLWWPRMSGEQNLYVLDVSLVEGERLLDRRRTTFGIREVKPVLKDPQTGEHRFRFEVNGRPIFLRGGDWVPLEGVSHVWQPGRAERLLDLAELGNMNIFRIWGEGILPPDSFYDECDRRGICLWQDFMFGSYNHRPDDSEFLANCRAEIEQTIRRLRNHPSLLLWCGGNEQYLWASTKDVPYAKRAIFEDMMPQECKRLDPTRLFHTSSPYGGSQGNWPLEGDWHDYTTINFEPEASVPLFVTEMLRVSPPSLTSWKKVLNDEELWPKGFDPAVRKPGRPAWPPEWAYHSTGIETWDRIGPIQNYCDPASAGDLIRVLGTAHGEYLRERIERERRGVPDGALDGNRRCWGNIVWRFNDPWPMIYSSVVDSYLEPKIAYYFMRRAYDPVLVCFERTPDKIQVWVVNDSPKAVRGTLVVQQQGFDGKVKARLQQDVSVNPAEAKRCLDLTEWGDISLRSQFLHATFDGQEATLLLTAERYLHLPQAQLKARIDGERMDIETDNFARQVTLEIDGVSGAVFEDNFFDMGPGQKRNIRIIRAAGGKQVTVRALNAEPAVLRLQAK